MESRQIVRVEEDQVEIIRLKYQLDSQPDWLSHMAEILTAVPVTGSTVYV